MRALIVLWIFATFAMAGCATEGRHDGYGDSSGLSGFAAGNDISIADVGAFADAYEDGMKEVASEASARNAQIRRDQERLNEAVLDQQRRQDAINAKSEETRKLAEEQRLRNEENARVSRVELAVRVEGETKVVKPQEQVNEGTEDLLSSEKIESVAFCWDFNQRYTDARPVSWRCHGPTQMTWATYKDIEEAFEHIGCDRPYDRFSFTSKQGYEGFVYYCDRGQESYDDNVIGKYGIPAHRIRNH